MLYYIPKLYQLLFFYYLSPYFYQITLSIIFNDLIIQQNKYIQMDSMRQSIYKYKKNRTFLAPTISLELNRYQDVNKLFEIIQECIKQKKNNKTQISKFIAFIRKTDYKRMKYEDLPQEKCFFLMKILNTWISDTFNYQSKQPQQNQANIILTQFYQYVSKTFNLLLKGYQMKIAFAHYLNNMSVLLLRSKQYKNALEYLLQAIRLYQKQEIAHPIYQTIFSNIATIYFLLNEKQKSQNFMEASIKISRQIKDFYIKNHTTKTNQYIQHLNAISNLYVIFLQIVQNKKQKKQKIIEIETQLISMINNKIIKLNNKNWFLRYYIQKKRKIRYLENPIFQCLFTINLKQFQLYCQQASMKTQKKKQRYPIINSNQQVYQQPAQLIKINQQILQLNTSHYSKQFFVRIQNLQKSQDLIINKLQKLADLSISSRINDKSGESSLRGKVFGSPKIIFKNIIFAISFYDEGIAINDFSNAEQKLTWDNFYFLFKNLQKIGLYEQELNLQSNEYVISKILSHHLELQNHRIRIFKQPIPLFSYVVQNYQLDFFSVQNREFKILIRTQKKSFSINGCFDEKSFDYYFRIMRADEYRQQLKKRISKKQLQKQKKQFSLQIIKLKRQTKQQKKIDLYKDINNILKKVINLIQSGKIIGNFGKISFGFDEQNFNKQIQATYYLIIQNKIQLKFELFLYTLNQFQGIQSNFYLNKPITYFDVIQQYGFKIKNLNQIQKNILKHIICDLHYIKIDDITSNDKIQYLLHLESKMNQVGNYMQKFIFNKYYRPIIIKVLGVHKKCHGLGISFYNQNTIQQQTFFVLCNYEWFDMTKEEIQKFLKKDNKILQKNLLSFFIQNLDVKKVFQSLKKYQMDQKKTVLSLQKFLSIIQF